MRMSKSADLIVESNADSHIDVKCDQALHFGLDLVLTLRLQAGYGSGFCLLQNRSSFVMTILDLDVTKNVQICLDPDPQHLG